MKKILCLILALLLTAAANLHLCARLSAEGETLAGLYSLRARARGLLAAAAAAEEILPETAALPPCRTSCILSLRPPSEDAAPVSDLLLRHTEGAALLQGCFVNGLYLGASSDGDKLREALRQQLYGNRPPGAVHARYAEQIEVRGVYTRPEREAIISDLCLLVSGLVPVIYTDGEGRVVKG